MGAMKTGGSDSSPRATVDRLRRERQAVILAHNYQLPEVQDLADFTGDSLELSRQAAACTAPVIVFCGVHFMAETAAILSPDKTVLLPDIHAGCPMADMIDAPGLRALKRKHPDAKVVCYVNSSAEVKAESDICCTSGNAERVVASIPGEILFVPDRFLGTWVGQRLGRPLLLWDGFCPTHARITPADIRRAKAAHPGARVLVHPECRPEVTALADEVLSTGGMLRRARAGEAQEYIVGTEIGLLHRLRGENPGKRFHPVTDRVLCPNMKRITPEKIALALEHLAPRVQVPADVAARARVAIERMLAVP
jgi:quinolinate synthase